MPYWISDSLIGTIPFLLVYGLLGILWACALLPRRDWSRTGEVIALGFAVGPAMLTVIMFVLGTIGAERGESVWSFSLIASLLFVLIIVCVAINLWKISRGGDSKPQPTRQPFALDEKLLITLIIAALVMRWIVIAYWSFTAYDALWVYGYEGRLYFLQGFIPQTIGYYPQFVPLQYTFAQMMIGAVNDHVARASIIFLHIGSIFAAHTLGSRLFNRRTGLILAAIWALYPHVGEWSRAGDLEIPLACFFTLATAYFLYAWTNPTYRHRRRYALIAGIALGIGLWTKPTMGAFVIGVVLLVAMEFVRSSKRSNYLSEIVANVRPRLEVALITGIAAIPFGGVWYIRNLLYGHPIVEFPPAFWFSQAMQSGAEFGWLILALIVLLASIYLGAKSRQSTKLIVIGLLLTCIAILPSVFPPRRMNILEWIALAAGAGILFASLWAYAKRYASTAAWEGISKVGAGLLLALPYFVTWFFSYSYHYRLSFAIVPLLILPTAVILAHWLTPQRIQASRRMIRIIYLTSLVAIGLPGVVSAVYDLNGGWDYIWADKYPDDVARYRSGNAALMNVVDGLQVWIDEHPGERLVVSAPGVDRLPFFFPLEDIRVDDSPTRLDEIADAAYFVYGHPEGTGIYQFASPQPNQVLSALGRTDILRRAWGMDDGIFRYDIYELHLERRYSPEFSPNAPAPDEVVIGGFARYMGHDISGAELWENRRLVFKIYWQPIAPTNGDYMTFVHLLDQDGNLLANWDGPTGQGVAGYYSTRVWQVGETIIDERGLRLPDGVLPVGEDHRLVIGLYDLENEQRLPVTVNGEAAGDGYTVKDDISVLAAPPE
jgi:hypothetical protein